MSLVKTLLLFDYSFYAVDFLELMLIMLPGDFEVFFLFLSVNAVTALICCKTFVFKLKSSCCYLIEKISVVGNYDLCTFIFKQEFFQPA